MANNTLEKELSDCNLALLDIEAKILEKMQLPFDKLTGKKREWIKNNLVNTHVTLGMVRHYLGLVISDVKRAKHA